MKDKPFTEEQVGVIGTIVAVRIDAALREMQEAARFLTDHASDLRGFSDEARNIALKSLVEVIDWMD